MKRLYPLPLPLTKRIYDEATRFRILRPDSKLKIECPLYFLHSLKDNVAPLSDLELLLRKFPTFDYQLAIVKTASHDLSSDKRALSFIQTFILQACDISEDHQLSDDDNNYFDRLNMDTNTTISSKTYNNYDEIYRYPISKRKKEMHVDAKCYDFEEIRHTFCVGVEGKRSITLCLCAPSDDNTNKIDYLITSDGRRRVQYLYHKCSHSQLLYIFVADISQPLHCRQIENISKYCVDMKLNFLAIGRSVNEEFVNLQMWMDDVNLVLNEYVRSDMRVLLFGHGLACPIVIQLISRFKKNVLSVQLYCPLFEATENVSIEQLNLDFMLLKVDPDLQFLQHVEIIFDKNNSNIENDILRVCNIFANNSKLVFRILDIETACCSCTVEVYRFIRSAISGLE
jgi:hypothetical protein